MVVIQKSTKTKLTKLHKLLFNAGNVRDNSNYFFFLHGNKDGREDIASSKHVTCQSLEHDLTAEYVMEN